MTHVFQDRIEAGRVLASRLERYARRDDVVVLGLPRGGVPVAFQIARALDAPLDVCLVRKLGVPNNPELAMGALGSRGDITTNENVVQSLRVSQEQFEAVVRRERQELQRREKRYRGRRPPLEVRGKTTILVDDGVATGATLMAAIATLRHCHPAKIVVAIPVAAPVVCEKLRTKVDELVCVLEPEPFNFLGLWYADFSQTTDEEVCGLLEIAASERNSQSQNGSSDFKAFSTF
ncbi:phosphoribosyltransferase [Baaleninema simplex]|uniref:phosphoribosyltransferase n=1 Tax=Baaleninema simplex TaxID=2862350 RepID=UPI000349F444|nr:phosphoribosyltransferase [Baaleninema simplex]